MNDYKATLLHDLLARVEALEAQAKHIPGATKMVPPPVATDEELLKIYSNFYTLVGSTNALRAIYDLGVAHGQAHNREAGR